MRLLDRSYPNPDDFHASMRMINPEAGPTVVGHVLRATAQTLPLVALSAVAIGSELAREGVSVVRGTFGRTGEAARRFVQEMSDDGEEAATQGSLKRFGSVMLDRVVDRFPLNMNFNPHTTKSSPKGLALLYGVGAGDWLTNKVGNLPLETQEPPIGPRSKRATEDYVL